MGILHFCSWTGLWGAKVSQNRSFVEYLGRKMIFESGRNNDNGYDQKLLMSVLWPEAEQDFVSLSKRSLAYEYIEELTNSSCDLQLVHASFHCDKFVGGETRAFPTRRKHGFWLGSGTRHPPISATCPLQCRPKEHPDWTTCWDIVFRIEMIPDVQVISWMGLFF